MILRYRHYIIKMEGKARHTVKLYVLATVLIEQCVLPFQNPLLRRSVQNRFKPQQEGVFWGEVSVRKLITLKCVLEFNKPTVCSVH
jgi:hypothetical protein